MCKSFKAKRPSQIPDDVFQFIKKLIVEQITNAPPYGKLGFEFIFHNGKLCRVQKNHEATVQICDGVISFTGE